MDRTMQQVRGQLDQPILDRLEEVARGQDV